MQTALVAAFITDLAGPVALAGVVILAVVYASHARRVGELRHWAGSAPERDSGARERGPGPGRARRRGTRRRTVAVVSFAALTAFVAAVAVWTQMQAAGRTTVKHPTAAGPVGDVRPGEVRVVNAAGVAGLAARTSQRLRQAGLRVVGLGNAPLSSHSAVAIGSDDGAAGARVARLLSIPARRLARGDAGGGADIVVSLGRDRSR